MLLLPHNMLSLIPHCPRPSPVVHSYYNDPFTVQKESQACTLDANIQFPRSRNMLGIRAESLQTEVWYYNKQMQGHELLAISGAAVAVWGEISTFCITKTIGRSLW